MREIVAIRCAESKMPHTEENRWEGLVKMNCRPNTYFGPKLWVRLKDEGVESFKNVNNYTYWSDFVDKYHVKTTPNNSPVVTSDNPNPGTYRNIWIIDPQERTLELKISVDISLTLIDDLENTRSGFNFLTHLKLLSIFPEVQKEILHSLSFYRPLL